MFLEKQRPELSRISLSISLFTPKLSPFEFSEQESVSYEKQRDINLLRKRFGTFNKQNIWKRHLLAIHMFGSVKKVTI